MKYALLVLLFFCFGLAPLLGWPMDLYGSGEMDQDGANYHGRDTSKRLRGDNDQGNAIRGTDSSLAIGDDHDDDGTVSSSCINVRQINVRQSIGGSNLNRRNSAPNNIRRGSFDQTSNYLSPPPFNALLDSDDFIDKSRLAEKESALAACRTASTIAQEARDEGNEAIDKLKPQANNTIENRQERLLARHDAENKIITSFLPRRNALVAKAKEENEDTTANQITKIESISQSLLDRILGSENSADACFDFLSKGISLIEELQFFTLRSKTQCYINIAKQEIAIEERSLNVLNQEEDSNSDLLKSSQELLKLARVNFLFAEAQSPKAAAEIAQSKSLALQEEVDLLRDKIPRVEKELAEAPPKKRDALIKNSKKMKAVALALEGAAFAYQQLADENLIEEKIGPLLQYKEKIETSINKIKELFSSSGFSFDMELNQLEGRLAELSQGIENENLEPKNPLDFLDKINHFTEQQHQDRIIGANGKVALAPEESDSMRSQFTESLDQFTESLDLFSEEIRTGWMNGIDLIRFGLCRNFNIHAVRRFDLYFQTKIEMNNSLHVSELKTFLEGEKKFHTSSHFLSPLDCMDDLMERLNSAEADKIIKWDEKTMTFNPFAGEASGLEIKESTALNEEEIKAGRDHAREAIRNIFKMRLLEDEKILHRFDIQFPHNDMKKLTVGAFRDFIEREKKEEYLDEGSCWNRYTSPFFINGVLYGLGSALASAVVAIIRIHITYILALWYIFQHWLLALNLASLFARG